MRYAFLVAWREYAENAKTKGFWLGIFLLPVILFISVQVPVLLEKKGAPTRHYVLVDQSGQLEQTVEDALEKQHQRRIFEALHAYARKYAQPKPAADNRDSPNEFAEDNPGALAAFVNKGGKDLFLRELESRLRPGAPAFLEPRRLFQRVPLPADVPAEAVLPALTQALKPYFRGEKKIEVAGEQVGLYAAVLIPADIERQIIRPGVPPALSNQPLKGIEFWSGNLADTSLRTEIERAVNAEIRRREYVARGMDLALVHQVERTRLPVASLNPRKEEGREAVDTTDIVRQWAPTGFVYLLWIAIFSIIQMLLNNVIEEKSNRIIEVLLSSVTPGELMMGKLAGIAAIGLTMVGAWVSALLGILAWQSAGSGFAAQLFTVLRTSHLLPAFVVYFLFGYVMYAALILALGSVCNTLKEAQNYMGFITLILMVPLLTMMFIPKDPNGTVATVLSWIPPYTPFIMMNRAAADPPLLDLIGTMLLLIGSTALALWMAGRIFRIGVLRTGQPPRLLELVRWLKGESRQT